MKFEHSDPIEMVHRKRKYSEFKITEIGGPEEIIKWRAQQAAKESIYREKLRLRDLRIASFESHIGQKLYTPTLKNTTWAEKLAFVEAEKKELAAQKKKVIEYPPWEPIPQPKKTILQQIFGFFARIWKTANY